MAVEHSSQTHGATTVIAPQDKYYACQEDAIVDCNEESAGIVELLVGSKPEFVDE